MKRGGGKAKGNSFERKVAKELSLWITNGANDKVFWRTHSSGGFGTQNQYRIACECGDIMAIDNAGKSFCEIYNIECRHGKCLNVSDLVYNNKTSSSIISLINEGRKTALNSNRTPLWFFQENRKEIMVMMNLVTDIPCKEKVIFSELGVMVVPFRIWKKCFNWVTPTKGGE